jgi:N-acetylglucosaminyldiphosphoundecaprenol N-acetyl-beta-D-mannosaminyltransferase
VLIGVGAAFDFLAGDKRLAPPWVRHSGLEWLFRLASEPRRLWPRYSRVVPRFLAIASRDVLAGLRSRRWPRRSGSR